MCFCMVTQKVIDLEHDVENCRVNLKVTVNLFSSFTAIQTVRSYNSTLTQARKLILSMYVQLILIYKIYEYHHA